MILSLDTGGKSKEVGISHKKDFKNEEFSS